MYLRQLGTLVLSQQINGPHCWWLKGLHWHHLQKRYRPPKRAWEEAPFTWLSWTLQILWSLRELLSKLLWWMTRWRIHPIFWLTHLSQKLLSCAQYLYSGAPKCLFGKPQIVEFKWVAIGYLIVMDVHLVFSRIWEWYPMFYP